MISGLRYEVIGSGYMFDYGHIFVVSGHVVVDFEYILTISLCFLIAISRLSINTAGGSRHSSWMNALRLSFLPAKASWGAVRYLPFF